MRTILNNIKFTVALALGTITTLLGGWDMMMKVLVLFVVLDYASGLIAAFMEKGLNSKVGFNGICKKILLFIPIMVAYALDMVLNTGVLRSLAIWFYIANEGLSILENLGKAGIRVPKPLMDALEQLREKGDGEETT